MTSKELREITGLSQTKFAEKYKFGLRQIQAWEQGFRDTPKSTLYMLERCIKEDYPDEYAAKVGGEND